MPLGGILILLCTATSKVHPADVISVIYPMAGGESAGSAGEGGSGLVGRTWRQADDIMQGWGFFLPAVHIFLL